MKIVTQLAFAGILIGFLAARAGADTVILTNGDKLTGKVGLISDGTLELVSPILGDLTLKLSDIQSYSTDAPATVWKKDGATITAPIVKGDATQVTQTQQQTTKLTDIKSVNPPPQKWTGSIVLNGNLERGNTNTAQVGLSANATLRRDNPFYDDRTILGADYNYGTTGRGTNTTTTSDNWDANAEYDKFFTDKFYGYGNVGYLHDRIAGLDVQLTPGAGVGYQWFESPKFNFDTEGGVSYVYEDFQESGVDQQADLRLNYHVDYSVNPTTQLFHDFEYLTPYDDPADYIINADAGIKENFTTNFFSQFKVVYRRQDFPPPGFVKDDLDFLLGVGWTF